MLAIINHMDAAFWAKVTAGGILVGVSLPGWLRDVKWVQWLLFGAGVEIIAWAVFAWSVFRFASVVIAVLVLVGMIYDYRRNQPMPDPVVPEQRTTGIGAGEGSQVILRDDSRVRGFDDAVKAGENSRVELSERARLDADQDDAPVSDDPDSGES